MGSGQDARFCAQCLSLYANWKSDKEMPKRCEYLPDDPWCWTCLLDEGTPTSKCRVATDLEMEVAAPLIQNFRSLAKEIIETKHLVRTCKDLKKQLRSYQHPVDVALRRYNPVGATQQEKEQWQEERQHRDGDQPEEGDGARDQDEPQEKNEPQEEDCAQREELLDQTEPLNQTEPIKQTQPSGHKDIWEMQNTKQEQATVSKSQQAYERLVASEKLAKSVRFAEKEHPQKRNHFKTKAAHSRQSLHTHGRRPSGKRQYSNKSRVHSKANREHPKQGGHSSTHGEAMAMVHQRNQRRAEFDSVVQFANLQTSTAILSILTRLHGTPRDVRRMPPRLPDTYPTDLLSPDSLYRWVNLVQVEGDQPPRRHRPSSSKQDGKNASKAKSFLNQNRTAHRPLNANYVENKTGEDPVKARQPQHLRLVRRPSTAKDEDMNESGGTPFSGQPQHIQLVRRSSGVNNENNKASEDSIKEEPKSLV